MLRLQAEAEFGKHVPLFGLHADFNQTANKLEPGHIQDRRVHRESELGHDS